MKTKNVLFFNMILSPIIIYGAQDLQATKQIVLQAQHVAPCAFPADEPLAVEDPVIGYFDQNASVSQIIAGYLGIAKFESPLAIIKKHIGVDELQDLIYSYLKNKSFDCQLVAKIEEDGICFDGTQILKRAITFLNEFSFVYILYYPQLPEKKIFRWYDIQSNKHLVNVFNLQANNEVPISFIRDTINERDEAMQLVRKKMPPKPLDRAFLWGYTSEMDEHLLKFSCTDTITQTPFSIENYTAFYSDRNLHVLGTEDGKVNVIIYNMRYPDLRVFPFFDFLKKFGVDNTKTGEISAIGLSPDLKYLAIIMGRKQAYIRVFQDLITYFKIGLTRKYPNMGGIFSEISLPENNNHEAKGICFFKLPIQDTEKLERKLIFVKNKLLIVNSYDSHEFTKTYYEVNLDTGLIAAKYFFEPVGKLAYSPDGQYVASSVKGGIKISNNQSNYSQFIALSDTVANFVFSPTAQYLVVQAEKDKKALLYVYKILNKNNAEQEKRPVDSIEPISSCTVYKF
jgi:hypothetical protein